MALKPARLASIFALLAAAMMAHASQPATASEMRPRVSATTTGAAIQRRAPPRSANPKIARVLEAMGNSSTWGHPDLFGQFAGMRHLLKGDYKGAVHYFRIGARYADKLSQLSIGMMYLNGCGVGRDAATACAWITLAAERKYPSYLETRARVCKSLSAAQQDRAAGVLDALRPEFGDAVAKRRMKLELGAAKAALTGSHLGYDAGVITLPPPGSPVDCNGYSLSLGGVTVPRRGCGRYDPNLFDANKYFAARDEQWFGTVTVGELQKVDPVPSGAGRKQSDDGQ